jgi:hypothetical protein
MELHPLLLSTVGGETEIAIRFFTKKNCVFAANAKELTICSTVRLSKILISCDKIITIPGASQVFIAFSQTEE